MDTSSVFLCSERGCGKIFRNHMALMAHEASHRLRGEYVCEICGRVFELPQSLGAHTKAAHGIQPFKRKGKPKSNGKGKDPVVLARLNQQEQPPVQPTKIEEEIKAAFAPLLARYSQLQARTLELARELQQNEQDLRVLWSVLAAAPVASELTPPRQETPGVHIAFQKNVSDHLKHRFEEWLQNRRNSFTAPDVSRALAVSQSTGNRLCSDYRSEGKLRLVGRRGRANSYQSTIFNAS